MQVVGCLAFAPNGPGDSADECPQFRVERTQCGLSYWAAHDPNRPFDLTHRRPRFEGIAVESQGSRAPQSQQIRLLHSLKSSMSLNRLEVQFLPEKLFVPVCGARALPVGSKRKTTTCWPNLVLEAGAPRANHFCR